MPTLPNLFVPGAMKSGTTTLHEYLGRHPDIFMSRNKEPNFWTDDTRYPDFEPYEKLFEEGQNCRYRGESNVGNMFFDNFSERVKAHIESPKFIFVLRNPVDRAWSHYWFLRGMDYENSPFEAAFLATKDEKPRLSKSSRAGGVGSYFQIGRYGHWLSRFYEHFDRNQILVIVAEDLFAQPAETMRQCFDFLGLPPLAGDLTPQKTNETAQLRHPKFYLAAVRKVHADNIFIRALKPLMPAHFRRSLKEKLAKLLFQFSKTDKKHPPLTAEQRLWLADFYREDVALLRQVSGLRFEGWGDFLEDEKTTRARKT